MGWQHSECYRVCRWRRAAQASQGALRLAEARRGPARCSCSPKTTNKKYPPHQNLRSLAWPLVYTGTALQQLRCGWGLDRSLKSRVTQITTSTLPWPQDGKSAESSGASGSLVPDKRFQEAPRLTIGCFHLPSPPYTVQPDGSAPGEGEGPEAGRHSLVGWNLVCRHGRPGCWLRKEVRSCEKVPGSLSSFEPQNGSVFSP